MSASDLLKKTLRAVKEYSIRPSRKMGQNFAVNPELIATMVAAAELGRGDVVLEIGAGIGNLTEAIAEVAKKVIAVEKDAVSARALRDLFAERSNVEVLNEDILLMKLPCASKIVSNLPYSISTPITFKILFEGDFERAVLTYQKEVAERLLAEPGGHEYSRLSVMSSLLAEVERVRDFPPESFYPKPDVSSTVVVMRRRTTQGIDWEFLNETLKLLFSQRKRKLRRALETYSKIKKLNFVEVAGGFEENLLETRVFQISPHGFVTISSRLKALGCR
ncbi:MAG: 16S rRNA (adenine(1518)-N(6)/adenine(1519)-N(6))-dimethyltransferase RsmA [Candidatus Methanomethylicaceae archaeon]